MINAQLTLIAMICCIIASEPVAFGECEWKRFQSYKIAWPVTGATPSHVIARMNFIYYFDSNKRIDLLECGLWAF